MEKIILVLYWLIFALGVWVENPSTERLVQLVAIGVLGFISFFLPQLKRVKDRPYFSSILIFIGLVSLGLLEHQSKFSVNDFFHMLYFVGLLSLYQLKDSKKFSWATPVMGLVLIWKYIYISRVSPELLRLPQVVVSVSLYVLVALILWLGLKLMKEQAQMQRLNCALEERQAVLHTTNERLAHLMDEVEGLTVYRERQKMAREIHDTVGHELTALIMKLEVSKYLSQTDTGKGMAMLEESIEDGRRALRSTRQVVETLTNSRRSAEDLNQLIARYTVEDGLQVHLEGQTMMAQLTTEQSHVIYRAVQEGMTNCLKHSNASDLWISLSEKNNTACLCIRDNGQAINGKQTMDEHFGIRGMRERVRELNGSFNYGTENGFEIYIEIPINREAGL